MGGAGGREVARGLAELLVVPWREPAEKATRGGSHRAYGQFVSRKTIGSLEARAGRGDDR